MYPIQIRSDHHKQGKEDLPDFGYGCTSRLQDEDERKEIMEKYWDITQELRKLLKMNAEVMPIIGGTFRNVSKRPRSKIGCHYKHLI